MKKKYKNGIAKLGRNRYEVLVTRRDPRHGGMRISRRRLVEGTRYQAETAKRELEAELDAEIAGLARPRLTLGDYAQRWLEARSGDLKPSTRTKYVNDLERHILPELGRWLLTDLRPRDVARFLARDPGAPNSKKNRLALLRVMAKDAIADELIDRDFCLRVSVKVHPVYTEAEPNMLVDISLDDIIPHIPQYWRDLSCTLAYTGMRWGEVTALHWPELDFVNKKAVIRWNNWRGQLNAPKTAAGWRTVPLADPLVKILQARRDRMRADKQPGWKTGLVFPTKHGTPHRGTPLNKVLKAACREAGITIRLTPHGLRRTWNNIARRIAGGLVVRAILGQTSDAMTDHYSLVDSNEKRSTAEAVVQELHKGDPKHAEQTTCTHNVDHQNDDPTTDTVSDASPDDHPPRSPVDKMVDGGAATPPSEDPKPQ